MYAEEFSSIHTVYTLCAVLSCRITAIPWQEEGLCCLYVGHWFVSLY